MKFEEIKKDFPLKSYVVYKLNASAQELGETQILPLLAENIGLCALKTQIAKCKTCGKEHFNNTRYCNKRLCPICARRRSLHYLSILLPEFEKLMLNGYVLNFLTLTIKDNENLEYALNGLQNAWRYMSHDDKFSRNIFNCMFSGGVRNIEIKKGEYSNLWHPHMHILLVKKNTNKDYYLIKSLWENATEKVFNSNTKVGSVHIESIKLDNGNRFKGCFKARQDKTGNYIIDYELKMALLKAVCETVKYITKFDFGEYTAGDIYNLVDQSKGSRFLNCFGLLYGIQKEVDQELDVCETDLKTKICKFCGCSQFELETVLTENLGSLEDFEEINVALNEDMKLSKTGYVLLNNNLTINDMYSGAVYEERLYRVALTQKYAYVYYDKGYYILEYKHRFYSKYEDCWTIKKEKYKISREMIKDFKEIMEDTTKLFKWEMLNNKK